MSEHKYMWNYAGTALLISIWSESSVQKQLKATLRNQGIWDGVARFMCRRGFNVNGRQCRTRIKNILVRYRDAKKSGNISGTGVEPFFHDIDRVMTIRNSQNAYHNSLPHVPPDPLGSLEQTQNYEEINHYDDQEIVEVNVKSEISSSIISEDSTQEIQDASHDPIHNQLHFHAGDIPFDDDQSSSSTRGMSAERLKSPSLHNTMTSEKCESNTGQSPPPKSIDSHEPRQVRRTGVLRMERLVMRAVRAQTEAVTKILTAQHNFAKQLLEADRERQLRLEYKLDRIMDRLDHFLPQSSSSTSASQEFNGKERHSRLNCLLDRLDRALPLLPPSASTSRQMELERMQEDKLESILNRLDRTFPTVLSPVNTSSKVKEDCINKE